MTDKNGTANKEDASKEKPGFIFKSVSSVEELRKSDEDKFIIKFSTKVCPSCKVIEKWMREEYEPKRAITVYNVMVDSSDEVSSTLSAIFSVTGVPKIVVTSSSLSPEQVFAGSNIDNLESLLERNFNK